MFLVTYIFFLQKWTSLSRIEKVVEEYFEDIQKYEKALNALPKNELDAQLILFRQKIYKQRIDDCESKYINKAKLLLEESNKFIVAPSHIMLFRFKKYDIFVMCI